MRWTDLARVGVVSSMLLLTTGGVAFGQGTPNNSPKLRAAVTPAGILEHEGVFDNLSDSLGGNRLAGAPGHDASAQYVADTAAAAGLDVSFHELRLRPRLPRRLHAAGAGRESGGPAASSCRGSPALRSGATSARCTTRRSTDITAPVWAIDLNLDPAAPVNSSTSGCQASDYNGMPDGAIALVQRGTCTFAEKFKLADRSGAGGMILFNEGQPGRTVPLWFDVTGIDVPSMAASYDDRGGSRQRRRERGTRGSRPASRSTGGPGTYPTRNVIAETPNGDPDNVIVVGGHLDSVGVGPGINDNGSGSATILEIAEQLAAVNLRNKVRFIWFSAEESGLLGSEAYVASLPDAERDKIAAMLNFDMIGSPNFVRFVYDGDLSDSEPPEGGAPAGSAEIEELFLDYFASQGLATEPTAFDGRSDYGPFIEAGIPAGGLFTGAEGIKTAEQAAVFGGVAGQQYDPCYHLGCDDLLNLSNPALDQMSDATAHATITLAMSTESIDGAAPQRPCRRVRVPRATPPEGHRLSRGSAGAHVAPAAAARALRRWG